ncbi:hypothetical protein CAMSH0001_1934 [Campylobacter showae RM3277]|uniref:Uncharacterized protein n=1 Tax=Campylobacter showae RM3277 TaxID=553219 RepID=C6RE42_9BACT|nr:hypothetical protein CAMSH0001_1934 [Campylobacter showae RM3277]
MLRRRPYVNLNDRATFVIFKIYSLAFLCALPDRQIYCACLFGQI